MNFADFFSEQVVNFTLRMIIMLGILNLLCIFNATIKGLNLNYTFLKSLNLN